MIEKAQSLSGIQDLLQDVVYLMGTSFLLGSLLAIILLLLLDFLRRQKP